MLTEQLEVTNKLGLHARAAAKVVSVASRFNAKIRLGKNGRQVDAKSIMGLLTLGATQGTVLDAEIEGEDSERALKELKALFARKFDEGE